MVRTTRLIAGLVIGASWLATSARADEPTLDAWARDFLGPNVRLSDGREVNAAAHYWTDVVGVAFARDALIELPPTPVDLNLDGVPDTTVSFRRELKGGLLANPQLVGLVPTPGDPAGTVGKFSVSTGYLGVREELDPQTGRGAGRYGFNCAFCHGGAAGYDNAGRAMGILIGRPNVRLDLGLVMATSRVLDPGWVIRQQPDGPPISPAELARREALPPSIVLDPNRDGQVTIAEWRAAQQMPTTDEARAVLLLAGPGRLDQSIDHRMDGLIPLANLQQHTRDTVGPVRYERQTLAPKRSAFNPVSLPEILIGTGVAHYSWSGKDSSFRVDAIDFLTRRLSLSAEQLAERIGAPGTAGDAERFQRLLTLDFRNVSTFGKECDDNRGSGWPEMMLTRPTLAGLTDAPALFGAQRMRELLAPLDEDRRRRGATTSDRRGRDAADETRIKIGRQIFFERETGEVENVRVLIGRDAPVPDAYRGIAALAPLDRSKPLDARIPVRCATCHSFSPTSRRVPLPQSLADEQRCDTCHLDHPVIDRATDKARQPREFVALAQYVHDADLDSIEGCLNCHSEHADFGPQVFSNSWLLPFDADADGFTAGDEADDAAAGGIGVDAMMNIDTLFAIQLRPPDKRPEKMHILLTDARRPPAEPRFDRRGSGWVRVAPLVDLAATAPYLHNGSVATLVALLTPPAERPKEFELGSPMQKFRFDTRVPGNRSGGHDYGTRLSADDKAALIRFLETLP